MSVDSIERFSGPPLAERGYIVEQARSCVVRPGTDDLETLVGRELSAADPDALAWDAWRREDGRWTVVASPGDDARASTWIYDPRSRSLHAEDAVAHRLASADVVVPLRATTATVALTPELEVESTPPHGEPPAEESPGAAAAQPPTVTDEESASPRQKPRKGRRASVPRWDEILFGAGQSDA